MAKKIIYLISFITGYWTHVFCLSLIVIGMPFSKFLMSLGTIILVFNWLLEGNLKTKFRTFFKDRNALFASGIFLIFVFGLIHTENYSYGLKDLRIKIPLLAFPIIFSSTHKLKKNHYFLIVRFFILSVLLSSIYGVLAYKGVLPAKKEILQLRDVSQFISHIRLSLMIVLNLFLIPKLFSSTSFQKIFGTIASLWMLFFLCYIESATGIVLAFITLIFISLYYVLKKQSLYGAIMIGTILIITFLLGQNLYSTYKEVKIDKNNLEEKTTASGNPYSTSFDFDFFDNGNYANDYFCEKELQETWNAISSVPYSDSNKMGSKFILIRYLTSKGFRKDKEGVYKLSKQDVQNIEHKIPNYLHANSNIMSRLKLLMFELDGYFEGVNSSGNSLAQRLEYWQISSTIVKEKPLIGYGTGDVKNAFENKYRSDAHFLGKKYQLRSHNQYFSTSIAVGIIGLILFLFFILYPVPSAFKRRNYFYLICLCIALLSFISEDTLETQDGVYFFAFLTNFFFYSSKNRYPKVSQTN